jgi:hypothetical protein
MCVTVGVTLHSNICVNRSSLNEYISVTVNFSFFLQLFCTKTHSISTFVLNGKCESFMVSCKIRNFARNFMTLCGRNFFFWLGDDSLYKTFLVPSFFTSI